MKPRIFDFHTHTFNSDGILSPMELIRQAQRRGYSAIGIADHIGAGGIERRIDELTTDCLKASGYWEIIAIPGVELTHVPPAIIDELAAKAKTAGAKIVIVHGETPFEGVAQGTNRAAIKSPDVDILAHPGIISPEDAALAAENGTYLEISARKDHALCNGLVAKLAIKMGAKLLVNSDAHGPGDLFNLANVRNVALGAGLSSAEADQALILNPQAFIRKLGYEIN